MLVSPDHNTAANLIPRASPELYGRLSLVQQNQGRVLQVTRIPPCSRILAE